jgi:uncharacterized protein HemX
VRRGFIGAGIGVLVGAGLAVIILLLSPVARTGAEAPPVNGGALLTIAVAVIGATGGWATAFIQGRAKAKDERQVLIDQIQEERNYQTEQRRLEREQFAAELKAEREQLAAERRENGERIDRFWADKAASREYVNRLQHHIWNRLDPPPPEPPAGYIP